MIFAFVLHAPDDSPAAHDLGEYLARNTPYEIRYALCGADAHDDLIEAAEQALGADAVIALLSSASVPSQWVRSRWEPVLITQPAEARVGFACVQLAECRFPDLLRRRDFFDNSLAGRRSLKRWLLARQPAEASTVGEPPARAAKAPENDLEDLRCRLADQPGMAAEVPPDLALVFARSSAADFERVIWLDGSRRTLAGIYGDLAHALRLRLTGTVQQSEAELRQYCAARRLLLCFDNFAGDLFAAEGKCSILRTAAGPATPRRTFEEVAAPFAQWAQNEEECLAALRDLPTALLASGHPWPDVRSLAHSAVALLRHRERAAELLELVEQLADLAFAHSDESALRHFEWEQSWILQSWNRPAPVHAAILPPAPGEQLTLEFPLFEV